LIKSDYQISLVHLFYNTGPGFAALNMFDDGHHHDGPADDGTYGVALPPQPTASAVSYYVNAEDTFGSTVNDPPLAEQITYSYTITPSDFICGDANNDETANIFDITHIISYLYLDGPPPVPPESADVNIDSNVNIFDVTYLIAFLYLGGPPPCAPIE
jgi:hypothetical protein